MVRQIRKIFVRSPSLIFETDFQIGEFLPYGGSIDHHRGLTMFGTLLLARTSRLSFLGGIDIDTDRKARRRTITTNALQLCPRLKHIDPDSH